jgi:hypothetical protein
MFCFGCMLVIVMCTFFCFGSPHAFAAGNKISIISNKSVLPKGQETDDEIYPAWNFLGCGTGWNNAVDPNYYFEAFEYAYTTGSSACSQAIWDDHQSTLSRICTVLVYIPTILATANISYGLYRANGSLIYRIAINQNNVSGWQGIGNGITGLHHVMISSNNGQRGTLMAAGKMSFDCY